MWHVRLLLSPESPPCMGPAGDSSISAFFVSLSFVHFPPSHWPTKMTSFRLSPQFCLSQLFSTVGHGSGGREGHPNITPPPSLPYSVKGLNHIAIAVPDLPAASEHYRTMFGAQVSEPHVSGRWLVAMKVRYETWCAQHCGWSKGRVRGERGRNEGGKGGSCETKLNNPGVVRGEKKREGSCVC